MRPFFDSNVILYSAGNDDAKADRSDALLVQGGWISVQVLNEVANVSRRKMRHDWPRTRSFLSAVCATVNVVPLTQDIHHRGIGIAEKYKLAIYDSMIVAAALTADCDVLYSEDMHDGLVVDGRLRIVDPFA